MHTPSLIAAVMPAMTLIALAAGSRPGRGHPGGPPASAGARKRIGATGRKARLPGPGAGDAAPAGYLYLPCARIRRHGHPAGTRRWVQQVPIARTTAKRIYYASDSWDRREAVISPGCISREQFEADTRCRDDCRRHGYTWEHCPDGDDRCPHGYPAGVIPVPGHRPGPAGPLFFATRQAAEDHLHREDRQRAGQAAPQAPLINELRRAMADAHPDRGGTAEQFTQARRRYQAALRPARR